MRILLLAFLSAGLLSTAVAADKKSRGKMRKESMHDQVSGQGYGVAGCGLGSIVFGPKPGLIQVVAGTLNGTGGSQTFGITSGTSNCEIPEMGMAAATFIEVNREVIAKDAARGEGESLDNLASIFQCTDFGLFRAKMKSSYGEVFNPDNNSYDSSREIIKAIQSDSNLEQTCASLG